MAGILFSCPIRQYHGHPLGSLKHRLVLLLFLIIIKAVIADCQLLFGLGIGLVRSRLGGAGG
jgi:hypothetical protein